MPKLTLTIDERQAKLEKVAGYAVENLYKTTVKELRELAKGLVANYTNFSKPDLVKEILDITDGLRKAKELQDTQERVRLQEETLRQQEDALKLQASQLETLEQPDRLEAARAIVNPLSPNERAQVVFEDVLKVVQTSMDWSSTQNAIYPIAGKEAHTEELCYAPSTIKSNKTAMKKALHALVEEYKDSTIYLNIKSGVDFFISIYESDLSHHTIAINAANKVKVFEKVGNQISIDPSGLLKKAEDVLANPEAARYEDVAIALAIATGRRMAEIMASGKFEAIEGSNDTLLFSGLTKARASKETKSVQKIVIPTLVDSELVLKAIKVLEDNKRRLDDPDAVNQKYAKPMSRQVKANWLTIANPDLSDDIREVFTFKSLRALYAAICHESRAGDIDKDLYFSRILGHDANDLTTAQSYKIWKLTPSAS